MQAQIVELREHCPYYRCVIVMLLLGLRRAEAIGLSWDDVDFARGVVYVRLQIQQNKITKQVERITPKSYKPRVVYMPDVAVEILKEQKAIQEAQKKEAKKRSLGATRGVWFSRQMTGAISLLRRCTLTSNGAVRLLVSQRQSCMI